MSNINPRKSTYIPFIHLKGKSTYIPIKEEDVETEEVKNIKEANDQDKKSDDGENEKFQGFVEQMLDLITLWYRDVLLYKATLNDNILLFKEDLFDIQDQAQNCSYDGLNNIIDAISETRARLNANVNFELTITLLINAMKENTR